MRIDLAQQRQAAIAAQVAAAEVGLDHAAAQRPVAEGVGVLHIGAESTRPNAVVLNSDTGGAEQRCQVGAERRLPPLSLQALALGVAIVNDVTGLADPCMTGVARAQPCGVLVMHALTLPVAPSLTLPADGEVVHAMLRWKTRKTAAAAGLDPALPVYDPGIGLG